MNPYPQNHSTGEIGTGGTMAPAQQNQINRGITDDRYHGATAATTAGISNAMSNMNINPSSSGSAGGSSNALHGTNGHGGHDINNNNNNNNSINNNYFYNNYHNNSVQYQQPQQPQPNHLIPPPSAENVGYGASYPYQQPLMAHSQPHQHQQQAFPAYPTSSTHGMAFQPSQVSMPDISNQGTRSQQTNKLDTSKIPNPTAYPFPEIYHKRVHETSSMQQLVPTAGVRNVIHDDGACSPLFIRPTLHKIPHDQSLLKTSGLTMGVIVSPLAETGPDDAPYKVPVVNLMELAGLPQQAMMEPPTYGSMLGHHGVSQEVKQGENSTQESDEHSGGPIRCHRCRSYINPFVKFIDGGKRFICNFCGFQNDVPQWYFCPLDAYGKRRDIMQRPELLHGSVDLVASKRYITREPEPLRYVFVIDVSTSAVSQDIPQAIIMSIKDVLKTIRDTHASSRVAFITFARNVHFYNTHKQGGHPQMMVMGNIDDVFVPITTDSMPTIAEMGDSEEFLDRLMYLTGNVKEGDNAMGSAMEAAAQLLQPTGGKIFLFSSNSPTVGLGTIKPRPDFKFHGTEKEKLLYNPIQGFWKTDAERYAKMQVSVDMFLFPTNFMETGTLCQVPNVTNGHIYVYHHFNNQRDSDRLYHDLHRCMTRNTGYDAILKVRCSAGVSVKRLYGHFFEQTAEDMDLASVDADTSFGVELCHDAKLDPNLNTYVQAALLYTSHDGHRLIRVMTARLGTITDISDIFKFADLTATLSLMSKQIITQLQRNNDSPKLVREQLYMRCTDILHSYRKHCAQSSSPAQLVLPESFKLLPVYLFGLKKSPMLREGTDVPMDEKIASMCAVTNMNGEQIQMYCYPMLFALCDMDPPVQDPSDGSIYPLPRKLQLSSAQINQNDIYLLDDAINTYFWIGRNAPLEALQSILSVDSVDRITKDTVVNLDRDTELGNRVKHIMQELAKRRIRNGPIRVFRDSDAAENQFFMRLVEDRIMTERSYVDELCQLHKDIVQRG